MTIHMRSAALAADQAQVSVENDFDFLSAEYRALFSLSGATAFQSPAWLNSVYTHLAPKVGAKPHIVVVRSALGMLQMVIPLVMQRSMEVKILQPADLGIADYNMVVVDSEMLAKIMGDGALVGQIRKHLGVADILVFRKIQHSAVTIGNLFGKGTQSRGENDGNEIPLCGDTFADWKKIKLSKKFRTNTDRRLRTLYDEHEAVDFVTFQDPREIERAIRYMAEHRTARFKDDILQNKAYVDFYLRHAQANAASGAAVTSGLIMDGELIAANFGIVSGGAYHALLSAAKLDEYGQYAPGLQSMLMMIKQRFELGEKRFDFGMGASRYKRDFAAKEIPLFNLTIARSPKGKLVSLVYNRAKPLKTMLRRVLKSLR